MAFIAKLAAVALLIAQGAVAAPWDASAHHTTHSVRSVGPNGAKFQSYHPEPVFETYGVDGIVHPLAKRGLPSTNAEAAMAFLEEKLGVNPDALACKSGPSSGAVSNQYFRQKINNIPVANAVANVALKGERVVSYGASFVKPKTVASTTPKLSKEDAIAKAEAALGGKYNNWPTSLEYFATDSDQVVLTHVVQVQNDGADEWYAAYIDANSGEVVNVVSFVAEASYRVVPFGSQNPNDGFRTVTDPHDTIASPNGWHQSGTATSTVTSGNNVLAFKNSFRGTTPQTNVTNNYLYAFNPASSPSANKDSATVNAFYVSNMMHDLLYRYGQQTYGHGLTNRLTGGGTGACLQTQEARGLGEGWSDALADWVEQTSAADRDFTLGSYVLTRNIRSHPYSTNKATNPLTYASLRTRREVHAIGEVWANIWHEIFAALIKKRGFSADKNDASGTAGNIVGLHLLVDALQIQPCNPTFIAARNAVIQADANRYGGANKCLLWAAFAKRGMGTGATTAKSDSTTLPRDC
ncbi:hypothetical protein FRC11_005376 [Ceratobasidium sp. 423]|nr:hypothetical protein FRC11_005376 [Ceratobasidium sp. 423]